MFQLLAATTNKHKIQELQEILQDLNRDIHIISPKDFPDFPEIVEDGTTFEENSVKKSTEASAFTGIAAMADDSGLAVEALGGAPGVFSARYAGEGASDADRIAKLLKEMKGVENRRAKFVCAASLANHGKKIACFIGEIHGTIAESPSGSNGFGYDPVFIPDGFTKTFAELTEEEKNAISHRGRAMRKLAEFLREEFRKTDGSSLI